MSGHVDVVRHEDDGDYHVNITLDAAFAELINEHNVAGEHGDLVVEIVPADEPGCTVGQPPKPATGTYDYGICTGADVTVPTIRSWVDVTGPYVLDSAHGWMEIHPAWAIAAHDTSTTASTVASTASAPTTPVSTTATTTTVGLPTIKPGAYCTPEGAYGTYNGIRYVCSTTNAQGVPYKGERAHWRQG